MIVTVLHAINCSDFGEADIVVVGASKDLANKKLHEKIVSRWDDTLGQDDKEFYSTCDNYEECWSVTEHETEVVL